MEPGGAINLLSLGSQAGMELLGCICLMAANGVVEFPSLPSAFGAASGACGDDGSSTGTGHRLHSQPRLLAQTLASH